MITLTITFEDGDYADYISVYPNPEEHIAGEIKTTINNKRQFDASQTASLIDDKAITVSNDSKVDSKPQPMPVVQVEPI